MQRFSNDAGIAIGPILFVIALLGIIGVVLASGFGDFGTASITDRVYADVQSQANLIRTKINECNLKYGTNGNGDGYPLGDTTSGTLVCAIQCEGDPSTSESGTDCVGNTLTMQNIWSGQRPASLPPPTGGFDAWRYVNDGATHGRCIFTQPSSTPSQGITAALVKAASKFSSQEAVYNSAGSTGRFVIWITLPTGSPNSNCASN